MRGPLVSDEERSRSHKLLALKQALWASRFEPGVKAVQALLEDALAVNTRRALTETNPGLKERHCGCALQCEELLVLFEKEPPKIGD